MRTGITKTVSYVVLGGMAGARQIEKAAELGVETLDEDDYRARV